MITASSVTGRRGHLVITESRAKTAAHGLNGDALLLVSSWESRCTEICGAQLGRFESGAVLRFLENGKSGRRARHDVALLDKARMVADNIVDLPKLSVHDFFGWRDSLVDFIMAIALRVNRPIDLVIDMTCLPKYYMLLLFGFCVKTGAIRSIKFFYAEGRYAPKEAISTLASDHEFTQGDWVSFPVPYLEGELNPGRNTRVIASIGFETFQARKFIRAYEAEGHILVTPNPGFSVDYEARSKAEASALATSLDIPLEEMISVPAGSVVETSAAIIAALDADDRFNDIGICLGTKPQALGMGIAAQLRSRFTLVCRIPDAYVEADTAALGNSWVYVIDDLSAGAACKG